MIDFKRIKNIMQRLGESKMIINEGDETFVVLSLDEYESLAGLEDESVSFENDLDDYEGVEVSSDLEEAKWSDLGEDKDETEQKSEGSPFEESIDGLDKESWIEKQLEETSDVSPLPASSEMNLSQNDRLELESLLNEPESPKQDEGVRYEELKQEFDGPEVQLMDVDGANASENVKDTELKSENESGQKFYEEPV